MVRQWQDELESKFGLAFTGIDRDQISALQRERGFGVNPWPPARASSSRTRS
jgi:hypothetical protein